MTQENKIKCIMSENGTIIPIHNIALISPEDCSHYVWINSYSCDNTGYELCDEQYYALLRELEFISCKSIEQVMELSIEEKAKRYDEVRKKIAIRFGSNVADEIFSQFEMSEDERVKKELINYFLPVDARDSKKQEWIAWLEKQGEQKQVIDYSDSLPKDNWELIHEFVNKFGRMPKDEDELNVLIEYVLKRQKSAWSEEDENTLNAILNCYKSMDIKWRTWLKSLKDRVQPKQEIL